MDIKEIESLKKKITEFNNRVVKIEASRTITVKRVRETLAKYGITDLKDYKKLIELRDEQGKKAEELIKEVEAKIESSQESLSEAERIISQ